MKTPPLRLKPAVVPIAAGVAAALVVGTLSGPQQLAVPLGPTLGPVPAGLTVLPATTTHRVTRTVADRPRLAVP